jgi:hypothetical protein
MLKIKKIKPILNDEGITLEWCKNITGKQVSIYMRNKGVKFAQHYHKGEDPSKNPERFFLIKGKVKFSCSNMSGSEKEEFIVSEGHEALISPNIIHSAIALEDSIFIEYRTTPFDKNKSDTYSMK